MQKITNKIPLEEHFSAPKLQPSIKDVAFFDPEVLRAIEVALPEFQDQRLRAMDQAGISIAVLSQTAPGVQSIRDSALAAELAHEANDFLHRRIEIAPKRFRGFACLALQDVDCACDELKRCIQELGFVGALVNGSTNGAYLDEPQFAPFSTLLNNLMCHFTCILACPRITPRPSGGIQSWRGPSGAGPVTAPPMCSDSFSVASSTAIPPHG